MIDVLHMKWALICDALRNFALFVQIKKRKNTRGGRYLLYMLLLVNL